MTAGRPADAREFFHPGKGRASDSENDAQIQTASPRSGDVRRFTIRRAPPGPAEKYVSRDSLLRIAGGEVLGSENGGTTQGNSGSDGRRVENTRVLISMEHFTGSAVQNNVKALRLTRRKFLAGMMAMPAWRWPIRRLWSRPG